MALPSSEDIEEDEDDKEVEPQGTIISSTMTLVLTSVGSGVYALPYAYSVAGVGAGVTITILASCLSLLTAYAMVRCSETLLCFSYEELGVAAFGRRAAFVMELLILVLLLGAMAALVTLIGDSLPALAALICPWMSPDVIQLYRPKATVAVLVFVLMPLSCVKSMAALSFSNTIGVTCTMVVCTFIIVHGAMQATGSDLLAGHLVFTDFNGVTQVIPTLLLSYCCHIQVPPIYDELIGRSVARFSKALILQSLVCTAIYISVGILGLRLFKSDDAVPGDVLLGLGCGGLAALAIRAMVGLASVFVFPLLSLPCRWTFDHLVFEGGPGAASSARMRQNLEAIALVFTAGTVSMQLSNLGKVTAITGATGGALLCYVFPCCIFLKVCGRKDASALELWTFRAALVVTIVLTAVALRTVVKGTFNF